MDPSFKFDEGFDEDEGADGNDWIARGAVEDALEALPSRGTSIDAKIRARKSEEASDSDLEHESSLDGSLDGEKTDGDSEEEEEEEESHLTSDEGGSEAELPREGTKMGGGARTKDVVDGNTLGFGKSKRSHAKEFFDSETTASFAAKSFQELHLSRPLLKACACLGYETPTPIQAACIPLALTGRDICGSAVTGSGKTAAFSLPLIERLTYRNRRVAATRVLVLVPTRELAVQVHGMITKLGQFTDIRAVLVVGGLSLGTQAAALRGRPDIIVGTPGRIIDHLRNTLSFGLEDLAALVLDEADRLLEMGFAAEVAQIVKMCPKGRQTLLFSATMTDEVRKLESMSLKNPVRLSADASGTAPKDLVIEVIRIKEKHIGDKEAMLLSLVTRSFKSETIIFSKTKQQAHRLKLLFGLSGLPASELHGNMTQAQRLESLENFRSKKSSFLIATDVAARGLDIMGVKTVINYDAPRELTSFLHRVGRTARAGRGGCAVTFAEAADKALIKAVQKHTGKKLQERHLQSEDVKRWRTKIEAMEGKIASIRMEEREERALRKAEMEAAKAENMMLHEEEIYSRPARTWFQSSAERKALKRAMSSEARGTSRKKDTKPPKQNASMEKSARKGRVAGEKRERAKTEDDLVAEKAGREAKRIKSYEKHLRQQGIAPSKALQLARLKAGVGKLKQHKGSQGKTKKTTTVGSALSQSLDSVLPRSRGKHSFKSKARYKRR